MCGLSCLKRWNFFFFLTSQFIRKQKLFLVILGIFVLLSVLGVFFLVMVCYGMLAISGGLLKCTVLLSFGVRQECCLQ